VPDTPTVAELFRAAGARLRVEFQSARESSFHAGQTGGEVEEILRKFLNEHLPQRFRATAAFLIDSENAVSKQCDVAIYDALGSPVLRSSPIQQILPIDHVAAVVEVKSSLNKAELTDAYDKIASVKRLKKTQITSTDQFATGSTLVTVGTMGIVFAFNSGTSLETLADNAKELNARYGDSRLWPDLICVLDKGCITYMAQFAQGSLGIGMAMTPCEESFAIPAAYQILSVLRDEGLTLNRFMTLLLSQVTFFPHRASSLRFDQLLEGAPKEFTTIQGYMYDTNRQRKVVPPERIDKKSPPAAEFVIKENDKTIGQIAYFTWQDGGYVLGRGLPPLAMILASQFPGQNILTMPVGDGVYSSVLKLTDAEFRQWPDKLTKLPPFSNLRFEQPGTS
jgi:hypothetical protein